MKATGTPLSLIAVITSVAFTDDEAGAAAAAAAAANDSVANVSGAAACAGSTSEGIRGCDCHAPLTQSMAMST